MGAAKIIGPNFVVEIDSIISELHGLSSTVTDHPVEKGANISDHARPEPDMVHLECLITNHPFSQNQQERPIRQGSTTITSNQPEEVPDRASVTYEQLKVLRDTSALLTVQTTLRQYDSVVLQSLTAPRDSGTFNALRFTASFKTIRVVQNKFTKAPARKNTPGGSPKQKLGAVTAKEQPVSKRRVSLIQAQNKLHPESNGLTNLLRAGRSAVLPDAEPSP